MNQNFSEEELRILGMSLIRWNDSLRDRVCFSRETESQKDEYRSQIEKNENLVETVYSYLHQIQSKNGGAR
jgi:hypothetical protein